MLFEHQESNRTITGKDGQKLTYFTTRNTPKRSAEILNGGSIYWIIKGAIVMRQTILNIETLPDEAGRNHCKISTCPDIMLTVPEPRRAMQGWRYLETSQTPPDMHPLDPDDTSQDDIDPKMAKELAALGLL